MIEPILIKAGDKRILINGFPPQVDCRVLAEEFYKQLLINNKINQGSKHKLLPIGCIIEATDECLLDDTETWVIVERWMVGMENSTAFNPIRRVESI
jgi:hypothetical protein